MSTSSGRSDIADAAVESSSAAATSQGVDGDSHNNNGEGGEEEVTEVVDPLAKYFNKDGEVDPSLMPTVELLPPLEFTNTDFSDILGLAPKREIWLPGGKPMPDPKTNVATEENFRNRFDRLADEVSQRLEDSKKLDEKLKDLAEKIGIADLLKGVIRSDEKLIEGSWD